MILALAFGLRMMFLVLTPTEESTTPFQLSAFNDEKAHYNYLVKMAEEKVRPRQVHKVDESLPAGIYDFEYYQSPLWYKLAGSCFNLLPAQFKDIHSIRLLNLIISLALIAVIGSIAELYSPGLKIPSMMFGALLASAAFFSACATNDDLFWLTAALTIYYGMSLAVKPTVKNRLGLILSISAGIWTKLSALTLFPAVLYALYTSYDRKPAPAKLALTAVWSALSIALAFPLFRQNYVYYGNIIPMSIGTEAHNVMHSLNPRNLYLSLNYLLHTFYFPFENYHRGVFQAGLFLIIGLTTLALIFYAVRGFIREFSRGEGSKRKMMVFAGLALICALAGLAYMIIRYHQGEARLAFGVLPVIIIILVSGADQMLGKRSRYLTGLTALFTLLPYIILAVH